MTQYSILKIFLKDRLFKILQEHEDRVKENRRKKLVGIVKALGSLFDLAQVQAQSGLEKTKSETQTQDPFDPKEIFRWLQESIQHGSGTEGIISTSDDDFIIALKTLFCDARNKLLTDHDEGIGSQVKENLEQTINASKGEKASGLNPTLLRGYNSAIGVLTSPLNQKIYEKDKVKDVTLPVLTKSEYEACMTILEFLKKEKDVSDPSPSYVASSSSSPSPSINNAQTLEADIELAAEIKASLNQLTAKLTSIVEAVKDAMLEGVEQSAFDILLKQATTAYKEAVKILKDAEKKFADIADKTKKVEARKLIDDAEGIFEQIEQQNEMIKKKEMQRTVDLAVNRKATEMGQEVTFHKGQADELAKWQKLAMTSIQALGMHLSKQQQSHFSGLGITFTTPAQTEFLKSADDSTLYQYATNTFAKPYLNNKVLENVLRMPYSKAMIAILNTARTTKDEVLKPLCLFLYVYLCFYKNSSDLEGIIVKIFELLKERDITLDSNLNSLISAVRNPTDMVNNGTLSGEELKLMSIPFRGETYQGTIIEQVFFDEAIKTLFTNAYLEAKANQYTLSPENVEKYIEEFLQKNTDRLLGPKIITLSDDVAPSSIVQSSAPTYSN